MEVQNSTTCAGTFGAQLYTSSDTKAIFIYL